MITTKTKRQFIKNGVIKNMERLIYFIKKTIKKNKHCKHFCVTCEFYDLCKYDC